MTDADLARLEALAAAATPGPWEWVSDNQGDLSLCSPDGKVLEEGKREHYIDKHDPDAAFIAAARTAVPKLVAEVRRLDDDAFSKMRDDRNWAVAEVRRLREALEPSVSSTRSVHAKGASDERFEARLTAAVDALVRFGEHSDHCHLCQAYAEGDCSCGLDAAIAAAKGEVPP